MTDFLGATKYYRGLGFSPIPINRNDKSPRLGEGYLKTYTSRNPTDEELRQWFSNPDDNLGIGIIMPEGVVTIDIDDKMMWPLACPSKRPGEKANDTLVHSTPRGYRIFLKDPAGIIKSKVTAPFPGEHRGIELKPSGAGYVITPPTPGYAPLNTPGQSIQTLSEEEARILIKTVQLYSKYAVLISGLAEVWQEGKRHELAGSLAGAFRQGGLKVEEAEAIMDAICLLADDCELADRARYVEDTYSKPLKEITGYFKLGEVLTNITGKEKSTEIISMLPKIKRKRGEEAEEKRGVEGEREGKSQADVMVKLAQAESVVLFHDERREPYIQIKKCEVLATMRLRSKDTRTWLSGLLWKDREKAPSSEALSSALNILESMANDGPEHRLYNRVAPGEDGSIWLDLCDEEWRAIHITRAGWEVVKHPPILFRRYSHQQTIPMPVEGGSLIPLLDYAHITYLGDQLLYVVTAISYLIPSIPHIVLIFYGPQGAGKTWALRAIRILIDPSQLDLLALPNRYQELVQNLDHNWCAFYDNVGRLPEWQSNVFCRAVTGTGVSKRQLYTDDDDVIYQYHRCLGLTDINIAAERGDLLQRGLLLGLDAIQDDLRKTELELRANLELQRSKILGAMLDILVNAMNIYPVVETGSLYRMADYTMWGRAITQALGLEPKRFDEAYEENINAQNQEAIRASPISDALIEFMKSHPQGWSGTLSQLYSELEERAKALKISTRQKAWPKKPNALSRLLNELAPSLPAVGLKIERESARLIHIYIVNVVNIVNDGGRQVDWGKGKDLKNYLFKASNDTNDIDDSYAIFSANQPTPMGARADKREGSKTVISGTKEKIEEILQLMDGFTGPADLNELENLLAMKGIDRSEFRHLISIMLENGLIVLTDEEKAVRRAGPKPPSTGKTMTEGPADQSGSAEGRGPDGYFHCPYQGCKFKTLTKKDLDAHTDWHQNPRY